MDGNYGEPLVVVTILLSIATLIGAIISAYVVWSTSKKSERMLKDQFKQREEQHQVQGLLKAFELLSDKHHREIRENVYFFFFEYLKNQNMVVFANSVVAEVMADFDVLGRLVRSKNISENDFFNVYGSLAYRCWRVLEKHIKEERKSRKFDLFMDNFEWLGIEGLKYWEKKGHDIKITRLYNPRDHKDVVDFQKDFWQKDFWQNHDTF